ncbi:MAG: PAS domain-containing protein [Vicinamibacterales bacterium]
MSPEVSPPSDPADARASEARWKLAFEANGDGVWDWDIPSGRVDFSDGIKTMLGFPRDAPWHDVRDWSARVHPDDLPEAMSRIEAHLAGATASYSSEHRLECADGNWKWVLDRGLLLTRDANCAPLRMVGSHTDITESRRATDRLDAERRLLETVFEYAPIGFAVYSTATGAALHVSARFEQIYDVPRGTLTSVTHFYDDVFVDPEERRTTRERVAADIASGERTRLHWDDVPLTTRGGERRWITAVSIPIPDRQLMVSTVQDVTHAHLAADALKRQAEHLREINTELVRFNLAAIDRELRMVELKQEVNSLLSRLDEPPRYDDHR